METCLRLLLNVLMVLWTILLLIVPVNVKNDREGIGKIIEKLDLNKFSIDLCQLFQAKSMTFEKKCLSKLSRRISIKLFWIVKNETALEYKTKVIYNAICILAKTKFISKQNKSYKIANKDNRLYLPN